MVSSLLCFLLHGTASEYCCGVACTSVLLQAALRHLLGQLPVPQVKPAAAPQHQQQTQQLIPGNASLLEALEQQQQQQQGTLGVLAQLAAAAGQWMQAAAEHSSSSSSSSSASGWAVSPAWLLAMELLQLAVAVADKAAAEALDCQQQQQQQVALQSSCQCLLQALAAVAAAGEASKDTAAAAASSSDAGCEAVESGAGVAAVLAAVELTWRLLCGLGKLGYSKQQLQPHLQETLQACMGGPAVAAHLTAAAAAGEGCSGSLQEAGLLGPQCVLQHAAAARVMQQAGLQQWCSERLLLLGKLLQQNSSTASGDSRNHTAPAVTGEYTLLTLLLLALHMASQEVTASSATPEPAAAAAAAAASAGAAMPAEDALLLTSDEEDPYFFHKIFWEEPSAAAGAADAAGTAAAAAAAAVAGPGSAAAASVPVGQAWGELAVVLCENLLSCLQEAAERSSSCSKPEQQLGLAACLDVGLCYIGMSLTVQQQEAEAAGCTAWQQQLVALQLQTEAAVQQLACSCPAAAVQVMQRLLLAPCSAAAAGHGHGQQLLQLAVSVMLQQAAALADAAPQQAAPAAINEGPAQLLQAGWVHLVAGLVTSVQPSAAAAAASTAAHKEGDSSTSSTQPLQRQLAWLLHPARLSVLLAMALAAAPHQQALLAAVTAQGLLQCLAALPQATSTAAAAAAGNGHCSDSDNTEEAAASAAAAAAELSAGALALCGVHACMSLLMWLLQAGTGSAPLAWMQQQLQQALTPTAVAAAVDAAQDDDATAAADSPWQLLQQPLALQWMAALLQYKRSTDELPLLLYALGIPAEEQLQQLQALQALLPAVVPDCMPGAAAAAAQVQLQLQVQQVQEQQQAAAVLLQEALTQLPQQQQQQQQLPATSAHRTSAGGWGADKAASSSSEGGCFALTAVQQALDTVLPAFAAALAAGTASTQPEDSRGLTWADAMGLVCCQQRGLQLLQLLQPVAVPADKQQGLDAAGFNSFGSYHHQLLLQQQLSALQMPQQAKSDDSSSSSSSRLPLSVSLLPVLQGDDTVQSQGTDTQQTAATAAATPEQSLAEVTDKHTELAHEALGRLLSRVLEDAVQKLQLCGGAAAADVAGLLKQQLPGCCAELELLGLLIQVRAVHCWTVCCGAALQLAREV
jgi:hypothetical protein